MHLLRGQDLVKTYGKRTVVDHVSPEVTQGEIVGLLGPNGAGKTTTFYMLTGMIRATEGRIYLDDEEATFKEDFFYQTPSSLKKILHDDQPMAECVNLIDVTRYRPNHHMSLVMDDEEGRAVAFLVPD